MQQIDDLLLLLSKPTTESTSEELKLKKKILCGYAAITNKPFKPHAVARTRPTLREQHALSCRRGGRHDVDFITERCCRQAPVGLWRHDGTRSPERTSAHTRTTCSTTSTPHSPM